jgi:A/G-specific adenine glycosylase
MTSALLGWFAGRQRDLPWRRTRDAWAVLVSELMLQQTQVARVVPRFAAFLTKFPTPAHCAASPVADVITSWAGLGYNRRAVNLHRTATAVVAEHGGCLPDRLDALVALPGIGPYTARAVLAFAFEQDVGVLDVNAVRVLSRVTGRSITQPEADALVPPGLGWTWNQAVLDLGATVCRPVPDCAACPLADAHCAWVKAGRRDPDPWVRAMPQSRFAGSDRQGRGRLVDALRSGPVGRDELPAVMGWPDDRPRADRVAATLVTDGLAEVDPEGTWSFPSTEVSPLS